MKTQLRNLFALAVAVALSLGLTASAPAASASPQHSPAPGQLAVPPDPPSGPDFVPDELLIRFQPSAAAQRVERLLSERGVARARQVPALNIHVLRLPPGLSVEKAVEVFSHLPEVEFVEPNYIVQIADIADPGLGNQWGPQKTGAPQAWLSTEGDPSVVIAVVDTGVDYRHSELNPNMWMNDDVAGNGLDDDGNGYVDDVYGWDYVNNDGDPLDDHMHGTHVAGIAAAAPNDNPAGLVGMCPRCRIMGVKVLNASGNGTLDAIANGMTYAADNGVKVINMSLGASIGSSTMSAAVTYAWGRGALLVAAAGNNGADVRLYPAAYADVMAVAATNSNDYRACFSNYGANYVSVAAPGESIHSTTPLDASGNDTYGTFSGTSMATPHVAGLAGLLFSQDPGRTNADVWSLVETTVEDLGAPGFDDFFGFGRISASRAVQGDASATIPPSGLFSDSLTASGYGNARKLARDASGVLHLTWHGGEGGQYRVLYAVSSDDGASWSAPEVVFASSAETYHPSLGVDGNYVYLVFPSKDGAANYQIFFTRKALAGGAWSPPVTLMGGAYHAVRPSLYLDPSNGRLHVAASSFDDAPYVYYAASSDSGATWGVVQSVSLASASGQNTRYAAVHANGPNVYVAVRTFESGFLGLTSRYRLKTIRSLDNGNSWTDLTELAVYDGSEYGFSLAGRGDRLYLGYEHGGEIYFRRSEDGVNWSNAEGLGAGARPSLAQESDGQAWLMWEDGGSLSLHHYNGAAWDRAQTVLTGNGLSKAYQPNLNLNSNSGLAEWAAAHCSGAPYRLLYGARAVADVPLLPQLQFSAENYAVNEGDGAATITVALSGTPEETATVDYATSSGTAGSGDYTGTSGTLTFNPGETSKTFTVSIREDTTDEPDETVMLTLSSPDNAVLGALAAATLTLADNDPAPNVKFSLSNINVNENAGAANVTVNLNAASGFVVTVDYATGGGTAAAGSDYTATSGTLTFDPGQTSKTFSVPILDDADGEAAETIGLTLSNPSNAALGSPSSATLTINANDRLSFSLSNFYVNENVGNGAVTVKLSGPSSQAVTVDYATSNGTAAAGSDYTATSGTLTFPPGEVFMTFGVPIIDDAAGEGTETIGLTLSNPVNAALGSPSNATLTINANDKLSFSLSNTNVDENAGTGTVTVKLNGPSSQVVTVNYATSGGSATAGSDYTATSGTLTFNPGDLNKTFSVPLIDDATGEEAETIGLTLSNPVNAALGSPSSATLTIKANDKLSFSLSDFSVDENAGTGTVTVKLSGLSSQVVTVDYATSNGSATAGSDYTATSGTLTFNPGETSKTFGVPLIDDTTGEGAETIGLTLSNPVNAALGSPSSATLTIKANDALYFSLSLYTISEAAGTASITVKLSGPSSQAVTVNYATGGGSATAGSDYTATSGTLTFNPGETSKTFVVPIVNDTLRESTETISLALSNPVNAALGAPATTTLNILDND